MALLLALLLVAPTARSGRRKSTNPAPEARTLGHDEEHTEQRQARLDGKQSPPPTQQSSRSRSSSSLNGAAVVAAQEGGPGRLSATLPLRSQRINQAQQTIVNAMSASGIQNRTLYRVQRAYNGVATVVDASQMSKILAIPGVRGRPRPPAGGRPTTPPACRSSTRRPSGPTTSFTGRNPESASSIYGIDYIHKNFGGSGNYGQNGSATMATSPDFRSRRTSPAALTSSGTTPTPIRPIRPCWRRFQTLTRSTSTATAHVAGSSRGAG